ncbi:MAG: MBL fold metallo-hydrolase [Clostridiales bacterium]|jgi:glyoxylase-like metal-dependent hydrolase (beta-lactamase superfamily II)|nr:MBL fold metallo-hydrolase [Clostridiales bacterium]
MYSTATIAPGIFTIDEEGFVRSYLIEGTERAILFDACASGGEEFEKAVHSLTNKPITLVLSHSDQDHTGGQEYFAPSYLHPAEYARYFSHGNEGAKVQPIWEGQIFSLGGIDLEVVLIPGHTPGSIALLDRVGKRLFVGDTISNSSVYMFGDGRNIPAFIESLKRLESLDLEYIHPAHGINTLSADWVGKTIKAAEKLLAGELEAKDPPYSVPCKLYSYEGVNFLF